MTYGYTNGYLTKVCGSSDPDDCGEDALVTDVAYDDLGRPFEIVEFDSDPTKRRIRKLEFDPETQRLDRLAYGYADGSTMPDPLVDLRYEYDEVGNIETMTDAALGPNDPLTAAGVYSYDERNRLASWQRGDEESSFSPLFFDYDSLGNLTHHAVPSLASPNQVFGDLAHPHRITERQDGASGKTYAYDADGNTTRRGSQYLTYDAYNRVTCTGSSPGSCGGAELRYTVDGDLRLIRVGGQWRSVMGDLFEWDVTTNTATAHVFAFGQEIAVRSSANATLRTAWLPPGFRLPVSPTTLGLGLGLLGLGGLLIALARLGAHGQIARHPAAGAASLALIMTLVPLPAWAGGAPQFGNGGNTWVSRWVVNDHLGNAVLFVTAAGAEVKRRVFGPYGAVIAESTTPTEPTARQFTGQGFEASMGLYDFKARWYDPETGRFLSIDPLVQNPFDPQMVNPYGYVRNNPLSFVDPTGMFIDLGGIGFAISLALAFLHGSGPGGGGGGTSGANYSGGSTEDPTVTVNKLWSWDFWLERSSLDALFRQIQQAWNTILKALRSVADMTLDIVSSIGIGGGRRERAREESGYATQDEAAKAALSEANPVSIKENREFGGLLYEKDGVYDYTRPLPGSETGFNPTSARPLVPDGATVIGDYHTHGDYSRVVGGRIERTTSASDEFNSDQFSSRDLIGIANDAKGIPNYRGYLGTPSGVFRVYHPASGQEPQVLP